MLQELQEGGEEREGGASLPFQVGSLGRSRTWIQGDEMLVKMVDALGGVEVSLCRTGLVGNY